MLHDLVANRASLYSGVHMYVACNDSRQFSSVVLSMKLVRNQEEIPVSGPSWKKLIFKLWNRTNTLCA